MNSPTIITIAADLIDPASSSSPAACPALAGGPATVQTGSRPAHQKGNPMTTTHETRLSICVSTGAEIGEPGHYCLYLATAELEDGEIVDVDGAAGILTPTTDDPATLDIAAAIAEVTADYKDQMPEDAVWTINRSGVPDHNGHFEPDQYGGYTVAEVTFATKAATGNLYDADTSDYIGPATPEQMAAGDAAEEAGENGIFLMAADGTPVAAGSWDAAQDDVRAVYAL